MKDALKKKGMFVKKLSNQGKLFRKRWEHEFASAGFQTFYQNSIPVDMMGRVGSIYGLLDSLLIIIMTFLCGMAAHIFSIQEAVIGGSLIMLLSTIVLFLCTLKPKFYKVNLVKKQRI